MKTIYQWLSEMEAEAMACAPAPARGHVIFVSGRTRIDVKYQPKTDRLTWLVDNRVADREIASKALEHARAFKDLPFPAKRG
ncbi:hypothetical protein [Burkholderia sp. S171]|uniref:hypothetical protein n=1 Tax=Burkholderia sp. S171 TaxID=1641860 RepID=UPI00131C11D1|nr:hypothetical protein [Burkholderia sp. S171]